MKNRPKPSHSEVFLVVEGSGEFPIDMLRYDSCIPDREEDAAVIARSHAGPLGHKKRVVLRRYIRPGVENVVTVDRWRSFGWNLVAMTPDRDLALARSVGFS